MTIIINDDTWKNNNALLKCTIRDRRLTKDKADIISWKSKNVEQFFKLFLNIGELNTNHSPRLI